jgi:hypothetical protein
MKIPICIATASILTAVSTAAWSHPENVRHWHMDGETEDAEIYVESYPNGTDWVNQSGKHYLFHGSGDDAKRVDCDEGNNMAKCKELLEAAKASGDPAIIKQSLSLSPDGEPETAWYLHDIPNQVRRLLKKQQSRTVGEAN